MLNTNYQNTGREYVPTVCSQCENTAICKYKDDVLKAEESFKELQKTIKDYPECLSLKLSCAYKKYLTTKLDYSDWAIPCSSTVRAVSDKTITGTSSDTVRL